MQKGLIRHVRPFWPALAFALVALPTLAAENVVEFPGTVIKVDVAAGKVAVKKEPGGTRFTFVATDKTQYTGVAGLKELKAGDPVTVHYVMQGGQYLAQKIVKR